MERHGSPPADYHLHTPLCLHAVGDPADYCRRALDAGLEEIGFSDHSPMREDGFDSWRMRASELDGYAEGIGRLRAEFPRLRIRLGLEVDWLPGQEEWIRELSARRPWDYLIGSVHYLAGPWALDDPAAIPERRRRDAWEVWSEYFDRLSSAAASGLFDVMGHADLPKIFRFLPDRDVAPLYEGFVAAAVAGGVAMEINTRGLRKDCREIYPAPQLLRMARGAGVPITFASDAHAPEEVGKDFAAAVALAREAGYAESCHFSGRKRSMAAFR